MDPYGRCVDHLHRRFLSRRQRIHDPIPDASPSPLGEANVGVGNWNRIYAAARNTRSVLPEPPRKRTFSTLPQKEKIDPMQTFEDPINQIISS